MMLLGRSRIIFDEEIDPDISGQPDDHGHKNNQCAHDCNKAIDQVGADEKVRYYKGGNGKGNSHPIAHIHGTIKERWLDLVLGATMGTTFVHLENLGKGIRIGVHIHAFFMALRTTSC